MNKTWLVIQREYLTRVRKKSFIIMTVLGPSLIAGGIALITWLSLQESTYQKILVIDDMQPIFDNLEDGNSFEFDYSSMEIEEAKKIFPNSEYTSLLWIQSNIDATNKALLYFKSQPSKMVLRSIEKKVEFVVENMKLKKFGIEREDYNKVRTDFTIIPYKYSDEGKEEKVLTEKAYVGFFFGILIYLFIFLYGVQVMRGVIEEKTNRIVEVVVTSIKPFQLMMGKIIGIALVGLTQFLIWVVLMVVFVTAAQSLIMSKKMDKVAAQAAVVENITQSNPGFPGSAIDMESAVNPKMDITSEDHLINRINWPLMIGMFLFYFLGGYLLYSALFAAIGAAVDNDTDTQQFMMPVTIPLLIAYFLSFMMVDNPESPAAFWGSIIPLTSPITMMIRIAMGIENSQIWELILSMVLLVGGFVFTTWLAAKIYRVGILMYGKKVNYKELWKWLKYGD
jgi:ABC-2 type transport system permease protein